MSEQRFTRPKDWLRKDREIKYFYREGLGSYRQGMRKEDITIMLNNDRHWDLHISRDTDKEQIPWQANFRFNLKLADAKQRDKKLEAQLEKRVKAWIAGYGIAALDKGDAITAMHALNVVYPKILEEKNVLTNIISKVVHGWLGLP